MSAIAVARKSVQHGVSLYWGIWKEFSYLDTLFIFILSRLEYLRMKLGMTKTNLKDSVDI